MRKMSTEDFRMRIEAGHENRRMEFKPPFRWNDKKVPFLKEKVIQTILGFTNTKDGGELILGVSEGQRNHKTSNIKLEGLTRKQFESFNYDAIKESVDKHASLTVNFELFEYIDPDNGKQFIIISISEFSEFPIICKRNGQVVNKDNDRILRRGDVYCRSMRGRPSVIRVTEAEMQEIIELAIDKGRRKLRARGYIAEDERQARKFLHEQIKDLG